MKPLIKQFSPAPCWPQYGMCHPAGTLLATVIGPSVMEPRGRGTCHFRVCILEERDDSFYEDSLDRCQNNRPSYLCCLKCDFRIVINHAPSDNTAPLY